MAITRLWFFTLKPTVHANPDSYSSFLDLWANVLELCATYSPNPGPSSSQIHLAMLSRPCPKRPHHFLLQAVTTPPPTTNSHPQNHDNPEKKEQHEDKEPLFVLISSYPSLALCTQADTAYTSRYRTRVLEYVQHIALRQMDLEDAELEEAAADPTILVTISNRDPLELEVARSLSSPRGTSGKRLSAVPPPEEEISGRDTYEIPPPPPPVAVPAPALIKVDGHGGGAGGGVNGQDKEKDMFASQRGEGTKWIRISKRLDAGADIADVEGADVDVEVFRLRQVWAR